jgi:hypothetical protein
MYRSRYCCNVSCLILQIVLVSSDGVSVEVERKVAMMSKTVQDMIEGVLCIVTRCTFWFEI